jgi:hypothetical protein
MSLTLKLPGNTAAALRATDVRLYLISRGWVSEPFGTAGKGLRFTHVDYPKIDLLLPLKRDLRDYAERMSELTVALSAIENRPIGEVLNDLTGASADILRFRLSADVATLGSLPLEEGIQFLRGGHDLLLAAAASTFKPHALHPTQAARPVKEFMDSCRLGQTERGSFVATILLPVPPEIGPPMLPFGDEEIVELAEPFPRRVTTRLMSSLGLVSSAIDSGETGRILDAVEEGVSANLCEALTEMKPPGDQGSLEIGASWARTRPSLAADVPATVTFVPENFAIIQEAGRNLRARPRPKRERFKGKVIGLQEELRTLFEGVAGRITVATEVDGQKARVKVGLNSDDFRHACDALRDKKGVAISGIIRQDVRAREYELSEPSDFEVLPDP